jgi:hypothetical protein
MKGLFLAICQCNGHGQQHLAIRIGHIRKKTPEPNKMSLFLVANAEGLSVDGFSKRLKDRGLPLAKMQNDSELVVILKCR